MVIIFIFPEYGERPRITSFDDVVEVEENDVVAITCTAKGNPTPTITWYRGSYTVSYSLVKRLLCKADNIELAELEYASPCC